MLDTTITAKVIKRGREDAGLTQDELAEKLHVSKQAVSNWERGKNLPDESIRENIEQILHVKLRKEKMSIFVGNPFIKQIPELKPLETIGDIDTLVEAVEAIIDSVHIGEFETTVKKMLYLTLFELLGYEIYYEKHCKNGYSGKYDDILDWAATSANLEELIKSHELWPLEKTSLHFQANTLLGKKIEWMAYRIGGELFEDFDDDGYRNGFVQKIGGFGEKCGYELLNLLPDSGTDILVIYKAAILDIVDMLTAFTSDE